MIDSRGTSNPACHVDDCQKSEIRDEMSDALMPLMVAGVNQTMTMSSDISPAPGRSTNIPSTGIGASVHPDIPESPQFTTDPEHDVEKHLEPISPSKAHPSLPRSASQSALHTTPHSPSVAITDEATLFASPLPITGERKTTTRRELWSWYIYYVGNSGLGPFNFAISAWQNLLYLSGYDPALGPGNACGDGGCSLVAYGQERDSEWTFDSRGGVGSLWRLSRRCSRSDGQEVVIWMRGRDILEDREATAALGTVTVAEVGTAGQHEQVLSTILPATSKDA
jgi:hypothetical protein